jgi:hypothetical protein
LQSGQLSAVDQASALRSIIREVGAKRAVVIADWRARDRYLHTSDASPVSTDYVFMRLVQPSGELIENGDTVVNYPNGVAMVCINLARGNGDGAAGISDHEELRDVGGCPSITLYGTANAPFATSFPITQFAFYEALRRTAIYQ